MQDQTLRLPTDVLARILRFTNQSTIIAALDISQHWRKAANRYFENVRLSDIHISPALTKDIHLGTLESRLKILLARRAPKFLSHNAFMLKLLSDPSNKLTEIGLFYPYTNDADKQFVNDMIGIDPNSTNTSHQRTGPSLFDARKILPESHNNPYASNKAILLRQACEYGNVILFYFLIHHEATPTAQDLNFSIRSNNPIIYRKILETVNPNKESLYCAMLVGNNVLVKTILAKKIPGVNKNFYSPRFLAAAIDSENKSLIQYAETIAVKKNVVIKRTK